MKKNIISLLIISVIIISCAGSKIISSPDKITERYWKLVELNGDSISWSENQQREAHFILKEEENRINGNTGCNTMGGSYELLDGNRIKFSKMLSTKMYCEGVEYEYDFMKALENTRSFEIKNDTLTLLDSSGNILAKMQAVYLN